MAKKPEIRQVPSDDCEVPVDGVVYTPHEDEWVQVLPIQRVGDTKMYVAFNHLGPQLLALKGEPDEQAKVNELVAPHFDSVIAFVTGRIVKWNWTDMAGDPLPQPRDNPAVFATLTTEELMYLVSVIQGNNKAATVKN